MQLRACLRGLLLLWPDYIHAQPVRVVVRAVGEDGVEDANQFAAHRYDGLLALERVPLPGRVVVVHFLELGVAPHQWQDRLKQDLPQILSPAHADGGA